MSAAHLTTILSELVRVADGRRFPPLDGHVSFADEVVEGKGGRASVAGTVVPQDGGDTAYSFTLAIAP